MKFLYGLLIIIISCFITFLTFDSLSLYHFPDIPTKIVLIRLIIFFVVIVLLLTGITFIIIKNKNNKKRGNL